jgi:hypothetical protein
LLAGVVLVGSGFAVVSGEKNVAKPGGVCGKAGASVVSQNVSLVCKKSVAGKLVWRVVKASTTTSSTTTTVAPTTTTTTTSAPKVAGVAPRVVSASAATGNAVITIADMSPDTGVYAVQWVFSGQNFNSYQMYRTTTKTMTVPYLSCTRTYTLRVFVMQANWQMTDGFVNQNVTPHSATFDLTMPACSATAAATTTTTTVALTCAQGGVCAVGDTGPGGGVVFYVSATNFTSTGSDCNTACKYLEAAPADHSARIVWATTAAFCYQEGSDSGTSNCRDNSIYSNTADQAASRTAATAIGKGMANTNQIYARLTTAGSAETTTYAAGIAFDFTNNSSKTDWYLPSKDELNQMCKWQRGVAWTSDATVCTGGTLNSGRGASGFSTGDYWSSSEVFPPFLAWSQNFANGDQWPDLKDSTLYVRPVRAFG